MSKDSRINLRLSKDKHNKLKKLAESKNTSMTALLEGFIDRLLKKRST